MKPFTAGNGTERDWNPMVSIGEYGGDFGILKLTRGRLLTTGELTAVSESVVVVSSMDFVLSFCFLLFLWFVSLS